MLRIDAHQHFWQLSRGDYGWLTPDMESDTAVSALDRLAQHSTFKGIRPMIQDISDTQWILKPALEPAFRALIERGITFDALVTPQHLDNLFTLLQRYPDLKVVIDHGAKPPIEQGTMADWSEIIARIAAETQAYCKLSGLITEAGKHAAFPHLIPYMEHLLTCFGAQRLMWGSDWPVLELAAEYGSWVEASETFISRLSDSEQASIWAETAKNFYNLQN